MTIPSDILIGIVIGLLLGQAVRWIGSKIDKVRTKRRKA